VRDFHREYVPGFKTRVDILEADEALEQQTGANEQDKSERHFGNDQGVAETVAPDTAGRTPSTFL
jgi:hypothetical protein